MAAVKAAEPDPTMIKLRGSILDPPSTNLEAIDDPGTLSTGDRESVRPHLLIVPGGAVIDKATALG
jgi:hypothetical protein